MHACVHATFNVSGSLLLYTLFLWNQGLHEYIQYKQHKQKWFYFEVHNYFEFMNILDNVFCEMILWQILSNIKAGVNISISSAL